MKKIFDTSSLLLIADQLFEETSDDEIIITSITLQELENIKTSVHKDSNIKYAARQLLRKLDLASNFYKCVTYTNLMSTYIERYDLELTNDTKILATAFDYACSVGLDNVIFYTNDLALKKLAQLYFPYVDSIKEEEDTYTGYIDLYLSESEMAELYTDLTAFGQKLQLYPNQYVSIYDKITKDPVDILCWTGETLRNIKFGNFTSKYLGEIKPYKNDIQQRMAVDSLLSNQITLIKGPAGTGKSLLAMGCLLSYLERGKIDRIIIFCNTVATKGAARLGFYPGTKNDKLLDSSIGNFLSSKLGGSIIIEQFLHNEQLILLPMSDIRGYDTSGMRAGIYIPEAQNLDITLLKLALQRSGDDAFFILDGDSKSQVDLVDYEGANNGLKRMSKIFRGHDIYGEVELKNIHRSEIARIAEFM